MKLAKVVDDPLGAVVWVGENGLLVIVAEEDNLYSIDDSNMVFLKDEIVNSITCEGLSLSQITWIRPGLPGLHRMPRCDEEAAVQLAELSLAASDQSLHNALDLGLAIWCGNYVTFRNLLDLFLTAVSHQDLARSGEAAAAVVASTRVIIVIVHLLCKLLCICDHFCCLQ